MEHPQDRARALDDIEFDKGLVYQELTAALVDMQRAQEETGTFHDALHVYAVPDMPGSGLFLRAERPPIYRGADDVIEATTITGFEGEPIGAMVARHVRVPYSEDNTPVADGVFINTAADKYPLPGNVNYNPDQWRQEPMGVRHAYHMTGEVIRLTAALRSDALTVAEAVPTPPIPEAEPAPQGLFARALGKVGLGRFIRK